MAIIGLRLEETTGAAREYVEAVAHRLESLDWRVNGFLRGTARMKGDFLVIIVDPRWPETYKFGWVLIVIAAAFKGWSWWLLPGIALSATYALWSRWWYAWLFRRGLARAAPGAVPRSLSVEETVLEVLGWVRTKC